MVQHYLHTAVFTWMLVEGINLYIKLVKVFSVKKQYAMYLVIGWGKRKVLSDVWIYAETTLLSPALLKGMIIHRKTVPCQHSEFQALFHVCGLRRLPKTFRATHKLATSKARKACIARVHEQFLCDNFMWQLYLIVQIAQQIIVDNSQLSGSAIPLDSRYKAEIRRGCLVVLHWRSLRGRNFVAFHLTSRLHQQFFAFDNYYLSHKS